MAKPADKGVPAIPKGRGARTERDPGPEGSGPIFRKPDCGVRPADGMPASAGVSPI